MMTEQPGRNEAIEYQHQVTIKSFHVKLRKIYHYIKQHCDDFGRGKCKETPKLVCLRSLRKYPPVRCSLYEEGYFPLTIDKKFAEDVAIMELDNLKSPKEITRKHGRRFMRMLGDRSFYLSKREPPSDPSETMLF